MNIPEIHPQEGKIFSQTNYINTIANQTAFRGHKKDT